MVLRDNSESVDIGIKTEGISSGDCRAEQYLMFSFSFGVTSQYFFTTNKYPISLDIIN